MYEIRESQSANAPMNQFNPPELQKPSQTQNFAASYHLQNATSIAFNGTQSGGGRFGSSEGVEMDISADGNGDSDTTSKTFSQSGGGSTSHSSYSPGQQGEIPYRPSPRMATNHVHFGVHQQHPQTQSPPQSSRTGHTDAINSSAGADFFGEPNEDMFAMFGVPQGNLDGANGFHNGFLANNEWELSETTGTGVPAADITAMNEGNWNQLLDNIHMTWDGLHETAGTEHAN